MYEIRINFACFIVNFKNNNILFLLQEMITTMSKIGYTFIAIFR